MKRSLVQITIGLGSIITGMTLLLQPDLSVLRYMTHFFNTGAVVLAWPLLMIVGGIALLVMRFGYFGYRLVAAPFILFILFVASRLMAAGNFWLPVVVLLLTFFVLINTSRRFP